MSMTIAATASISAGGDDPILFRGPFEETIPQMAALGYCAVELHIYDSDQIDRKQLYRLLEENHVSSPPSVQALPTRETESVSAARILRNGLRLSAA